MGLNRQRMAAGGMEYTGCVWVVCGLCVFFFCVVCGVDQREEGSVSVCGTWIISTLSMWRTSTVQNDHNKQPVPREGAGRI